MLEFISKLQAHLLASAGQIDKLTKEHGIEKEELQAFGYEYIMITTAVNMTSNILKTTAQLLDAPKTTIKGRMQ